MTAHFASLPNELIREILKLTHPEDLENFAQISRNVFSLAVPFLKEHRALICKYRTLYNPPGHRTIANLLSTIIANPRIASYVQKVELGPLFQDYSVTPANVYTEKELENFSTAALDNECLKVPSDIEVLDEKEFWSTQIRGGEDHILLAILLPLLSNLTVLTTTADPTQSIWYDSAIEQAASTTKPTLCKLTHIRLNPDFVDGRYDLFQIQSFCALPSVRVLTASSAYSMGSLSRLSQDITSNVTHLKLWESCIDSKALYEFLRGFPKLQSFTYSYVVEFYTAAHDVCLIKSSLLAYCKATLRSLTLLAPDHSHMYSCFMGSLRDFDILEELYTEWNFLIPMPGGSQLNENLPASLVRLEIHDSIGREKLWYHQVLRSAQYAKEHRLQKLKWLVFGGIRIKWSLETIDRDLKDACLKLGITLFFSPYAPKSGH